MTVSQSLPSNIRGANAPAIPTLLYDGDCDFCRRWVERWKGLTGQRVAYLAYQERGKRFAELPGEALRRAAHLVEPDGSVHAGARAIFGMLARAGRRKWLLVFYEEFPKFAASSEAVYGLVAGHRGIFNRIDLALLGRNTLPVTHEATRRWLLRFLGLIYVFAFLSLSGQIRGLIGSHGILPIAPQLHGLAAGDGGTPFLQLPTLLWINASDGMLLGLCLAGAVLGVMMILRIFPVLAAIGTWLCYLSLTVAGQAFLAFQWDALLLEAGFLAIFLSPLQWHCFGRAGPRTSRVIIWLYRWLLFRVMFLAGLVKLLGGDPTWMNLRALSYHFWTQPLPTWTAWYANRLPPDVLGFLVVMTFFMELVVPFFYFAPRQLRRWAVALTVAFQLLIMASGNYGFFNLLTIVLCIPLLDDTFWPFKLMPAPPHRREEPKPRPAPARADTNSEPAFRVEFRRAFAHSLPPWLTVPLMSFLVFITMIEGFHRVRMAGWIPTWADQTASFVGSFRSANAYGLFETMTTRRPEIIVEGSDDGANWTAFAFKWKPGDVDRAPRFCTPHMPRLDWEMWFAGLTMEHDELPRWFVQFLKRLLEGSPQVAELLEPSPFGAHPPRFVRATIFYYRFTTAGEKSRDGAWWRRSKSDFTTGAIMLGPNGELTHAAKSN